MAPQCFTHPRFPKPRLLTLTLLLPLVCACLRVHALAQQPLSPNVEVVVTNGADGRPVPNAQVTITRSGRGVSGVPLRDIRGVTDAGGRFFRKAADFPADGRPAEVVVTADGFERSQTELSPDALRAAYGAADRTLRIRVSLSEPSAPPRPTQAAAEPARPAPPDTQEPEEAGAPVYLIGIWWTLAIMVFLGCIFGLWFLWRYKAPGKEADGDANLEHTLAALNRAVRDIRDQQKVAQFRMEELVSQVAKNNEILLKGVTIISINEESTRPFSGLQIDASFRPQAAPAPPPSPASLREVAASAYVRLMSKNVVDPEPVYLDVEEPSSIADMLSDAAVYLKQVGNSQGALVLFRDGDDSGWVYPNPSLVFRRAALRPIFPSLTEREFKNAKEQIAPKRAARVGARRWRVLPD